MKSLPDFGQSLLVCRHIMSSWLNYWHLKATFLNIRNYHFAYRDYLFQYSNPIVLRPMDFAPKHGDLITYCTFAALYFSASQTYSKWRILRGGAKMWIIYSIGETKFYERGQRLRIIILNSTLVFSSHRVIAFAKAQFIILGVLWFQVWSSLLTFFVKRLHFPRYSDTSYVQRLLRTS